MVVILGNRVKRWHRFFRGTKKEWRWHSCVESLIYDIATTSVHCCRVFTGCGSMVLHFGWRYSPTAAFTAQHLSTYRDNCREFLMSKHVNDFVLRRPLVLLFRGPVEPPSAVDVSLLLRPQSGTACQKQSVLQHLWRCSESHWRRNCLRGLTLTNLNN